MCAKVGRGAHAGKSAGWWYAGMGADPWRAATSLNCKDNRALRKSDAP